MQGCSVGLGLRCRAMQGQVGLCRAMQGYLSECKLYLPTVILSNNFTIKYLFYNHGQKSWDNSRRSNPSPHPTNNVGRVYREYFLSFNFVQCGHGGWGGGGRENCKKISKRKHCFEIEPRKAEKYEYCSIVPRTFVQDRRVMQGYVGLFTTMQSCVGLCKAMQGYVGLCRVMYINMNIVVLSQELLWRILGLCKAMQSYVRLCNETKRPFESDYKGAISFLKRMNTRMPRFPSQKKLQTTQMRQLFGRA